MPRTGRTTKLTPQVQESIVRAVTAGVPVVQAAQLAGIDKATVLEWIARGEGRHQRPARALYADFADAIARARVIDEARRLARLEQAGRGAPSCTRKSPPLPMAARSSSATTARLIGAPMHSIYSTHFPTAGAPGCRPICPWKSASSPRTWPRKSVCPSTSSSPRRRPSSRSTTSATAAKEGQPAGAA